MKKKHIISIVVTMLILGILTAVILVTTRVEDPSVEQSTTIATTSPATTEITTEPTFSPTDAVIEQMAGNWIQDYDTLNDNAIFMNLFADGTWVSRGTLPRHHTNGGSFVIIGEENGVYQLKFTIEHSTNPYAAIGHTFDHYQYDAENDRLGIIYHYKDSEDSDGWFEFDWFVRSDG